MESPLLGIEEEVKQLVAREIEVRPNTHKYITYFPRSSLCHFSDERGGGL